MILGGILLAGMSHSHPAGGGSGLSGLLPQSVAAVPLGGPYTPDSWASAFLAAIPEPRTACNMGAVEAWEDAEGGAWNDAAADNPLNTTQPERGSYPINGDNVQAFPSWGEGLQANVTVITNGRYGGILSALQAGTSAQAVADAVAASPWGTEQFQASC
jgi:hypothetical protein